MEKSAQSELFTDMPSGKQFAIKEKKVNDCIVSVAFKAEGTDCTDLIQIMDLLLSSFSRACASAK